jgi:hypothetical protein
VIGFLISGSLTVARAACRASVLGAGMSSMLSRATVGS